jgi:hypothetical protein
MLSFSAVKPLTYRIYIWCVGSYCPSCQWKMKMVFLNFDSMVDFWTVLWCICNDHIYLHTEWAFKIMKITQDRLQKNTSPPAPSVGDCFWLLFYNSCSRVCIQFWVLSINMYQFITTWIACHRKVWLISFHNRFNKQFLWLA